MPTPRMKQRRVVHKSTAGILKPIPEAVDLVGNPPPGLTTKTVALLHQRALRTLSDRCCSVRSDAGMDLASSPAQQDS
jgi:hypothetical protein